LKRGDLVTVVLPGAYGKPRPALIVQSDAFADLESVVIAPLTSTVGRLPLLRVLISPDETNGLLKPSDIMVDKLSAVPRAKLGLKIGSVSRTTLDSVVLSTRGLLET